MMGFVSSLMYGLKPVPFVKSKNGGGAGAPGPWLKPFAIR